MEKREQLPCRSRIRMMNKDISTVDPTSIAMTYEWKDGIIKCFVNGDVKHSNFILPSSFFFLTQRLFIMELSRFLHVILCRILHRRAIIITITTDQDKTNHYIPCFWIAVCNDRITEFSNSSLNMIQWKSSGWIKL